MATANQVLAILKSHVEGDEEQLLSIALQIAASEARRGRDAKADELRSLVDLARSNQKAGQGLASAPTSLSFNTAGRFSGTHERVRAFR